MFLYLCSGERSRLGCTGRRPRRPERVFGEAPNTARGARALPGRASPSFAGGKPSTHHGTSVRAESAERKWRHDATTDGRSNEAQPHRFPYRNTVAVHAAHVAGADRRILLFDVPPGHLVRCADNFSYFRLLKNSTRLRRSCFDRICAMPSGMGERAFCRVSISAFLTVTTPLSGELRTSSLWFSLLSTPP